MSTGRAIAGHRLNISREFGTVPSEIPAHFQTFIHFLEPNNVVSLPTHPIKVWEWPFGKQT